MYLHVNDFYEWGMSQKFQQTVLIELKIHIVGFNINKRFKILNHFSNYF